MQISCHFCLTQVQYLFDRPGSQQDPVADTSDNTIIGTHCSCPTRLIGFKNPPEPFELIYHRGNRDAVPRTFRKRMDCFFQSGQNSNLGKALFK